MISLAATVPFDDRFNQQARVEDLSPKLIEEFLEEIGSGLGGEVNDPLDEEERLCNLVADNISPRLVPNVEMITVEGKTLLVVEVFLSGLRPHYIKAVGPENGVFVRLGSTNRHADRELVGELRRSAEEVSFDELPMRGCSVDDLDLKAARTLFTKNHPLDEQELITLKLLVQNQGKSVPTKGSMLLFAKKREFYFSDAWIQCGRFSGTDKAEIFDHIELCDHLPQAVDSIMLFLKKHAMRGADFSEVRRKDVWSIPLGILREAVINALVHTDYSQRGAPIRIAFFDDRIEIENPIIPHTPDFYLYFWPHTGRHRRETRGCPCRRFRHIG